jgi:uncharacterized Zn finger protein
LVDEVRCKECGHISEQRFKIPKSKEYKDLEEAIRYTMDQIETNRDLEKDV